MNPRKRRAIARAVLAGIPKSKLNSNNIRKFLLREKAKGRLNLTEENIQDIIFPNGMVNRPLGIGASVSAEDKLEVHEDEATTVTDEDINDDIADDNITEEVSEAYTDVETVYTLNNSKTELQARADELGIEYKKSLSKSKLLELINNN